MKYYVKVWSEMPAYTTDVYFVNRPIDTAMGREWVLDGPDRVKNALHRNDVWVYAPQETKGRYTVENFVLPDMNRINTLEECYEYYKQELLSRLDPEGNVYLSMIKSLFIDQAIYFEDLEMYPICREKVKELEKDWTEICQRYPTGKREAEVLKKILLQKAALFDGEWEAFLENLEERKRKTIVQLEKKLGIIV